MHFTSTRGNKEVLTSSQAIIRGLSDDGGLYVPSEFPNINKELTDLIKMNYKDLALFVLEKYFTDFTTQELRECINKAYDKKFSLDEITPLVKVEDNYFLELYHGPTCAFKDIALTIMPHLMTMALKKNKIDKEVIILTATSGDTGKAALEGYKDVDNTKIIVFYPKNGVSPIQKLQMTSQDGSNTFVVSINGNFDDAQSAVKSIFNNQSFKDELYNNGYILSSANSINIGRLIPQIVYYFYAYFELVKTDEIKLYDKINFCVPTGNFGDILAGYYAKKMGLPINNLICSSNDNNVLYDFFNSGIYNINRELILTTSPSMDILVSSNLERLLYDIYKQDTVKINDFSLSLNKYGTYKINNFASEKLNNFYSSYATELEVSNSISDVFFKYNYLIDTHTAVAYACLNKYIKYSKDTTKTVILSTASPYKFSENVLKSLDIDCSFIDEFESIDKLSTFTKTQIPTPILKLKNATSIHKCICNKNEIYNVIKNIIKV